MSRTSRFRSGHVRGRDGHAYYASGYAEGTDFEQHDAATLNAELSLLGTKYGALVVASDFGGTLTQSELDILNARTPEIVAFLNNGGGLYAMAESNNGAHLTPGGGHFGFLPLVVSSVSFDQSESGLTVTPFGASLGLLDTDVNGNASHNVFTVTGALGVVDMDARGDIMSLASRERVVNCPPGNTPPQFDPATPACGSILSVVPGDNLQFTVAASDVDFASSVTLNVTGLPPAASMVPGLPANGNPVNSTFSWTPTAGDSGDYALDFSVTDNCAEQTQCSLTLRVETNRNPDCSGASASVAVLWPPNHGLAPVTVTGVTDPDGDPVTITVTGVTQDEPLNAQGDGNTCPDAVIQGDSASVRVERSGAPKQRGNGRVYTIAFRAEDGRGGSCEGTIDLCVPHDQGSGNVCVKDALVVNSLGPCGSSPPQWK